MRVQVYGEEITSEVVLVAKPDVNGDHTQYGLRIFLASPDVLHQDPDDDDRPAVTLWVPWTPEEGHNFALLGDVTRGLQNVLWMAMRKEHEPHMD